MIRATEAPRDNVMHVEPLAFVAQGGLQKPASLAGIAIALSRSLSLIFPVLTSPIVLRRPALPRRMPCSSDVCCLPRRIASLRAEFSSRRPIRHKRSSTKSAHSINLATPIPALPRAIFRAEPMGGYFKVGIATDTGFRDSVSWWTDPASSGYPAGIRTKSPLRSLDVGEVTAVGAGNLHV
jgi:hypothetical protein